MVVRVRLFAGLRERAGSSELELELPEGARVRDALDRLGHVAGDLPVVMAVNRDYADADALLAAGDELALIPPVSGGRHRRRALLATRRRRAGRCRWTTLAARVRDPRAGAVRDLQRRDARRRRARVRGLRGDGRRGDRRGSSRRRSSATACARRPPSTASGRVPLGEASVIVAAGAPHRGEAFAGAREIIDEIKARAPIWKKEEDEWKQGTVPPPGPAA